MRHPPLAYHWDEFGCGIENPSDDGTGGALTMPPKLTNPTSYYDLPEPKSVICSLHVPAVEVLLNIGTSQSV